VSSQRSLYENNVAAARAVADFAWTHQVPTVFFTSSNSVYRGNRERRPVLETDPPGTVDEYGRSKVESKRRLTANSSDFNTISIRCPNIIDAGRLGLLFILFDFIREGRKVRVLGDVGIQAPVLDRHTCFSERSTADWSTTQAATLIRCGTVGYLQP
jgi:nucleoside-diphosphate-sugar epimerase